MAYSIHTFSSNQVLSYSGTFDDLQFALEFALKASGKDSHMNEADRKRGCKLIYQISKKGKYCIGWAFNTIPTGWKEYEFDFDPEIVSKIIVQYLKKQEPINIEDGELRGDGSTSKGFIMTRDCPCPEDIFDIENRFYMIVYFQAYENYYAK